MPTQAEYWNEAGAAWVAGQAQLDALLAPLGELGLRAASLRPGDAVLDVGCGCGDTTMEIAGRVGPTGRVVGLDLSAPMLARARERITEPNVELVLGDAATAPLPAASFDVVFSRFGVMFFDDPRVAFTHLRAALRPNGRIAWVVWQDLVRNPWMSVPVAAVDGLVELPELGGAGEPGPFGLSDTDHVRSLLETAGYGDIALVGHETDVTLGGGLGLDGTVAFMIDQGPLRRVLAGTTDAVRVAATERVAAALAPYDGPDGVRLGAAVWVVTARRDGRD